MRCFGDGDPLYERYHDAEWGRPVADEHRLLEKLCLEGFQSGLSWLTILRKRENFRAAFAGFDPEVVAAYDEDDVVRLLDDAGIIRHRGKIEATLANARAALALREAGAGLGALIWSHRPQAAPVRGSLADMPSLTPESTALSKDLKSRGFRFVGPTTAYALMQACGMVNDHIATCPVRDDVERERLQFLRSD